MTEVDKKLDTLAEKINREHRRVESAVGSALEHAQRAGRLLIEAKERVKHGEWLPWLEENFEGSERVAQMYMRVHGHWPEIEAKTKSVSDLTLTGALQSIGPPKAEITRERAEGELRWAGAGEEPETTTAVEMPATEREPGVIEQIQASPEGREALAAAGRDLAEGQARDRVRFRISDLYFLLRKVSPEDVAKDVVAEHVGEAAQNAVLGRPERSRRNDDVEYAVAVHAWLEKYLQVLKEADAHLRGLGVDE